MSKSALLLALVIGLVLRADGALAAEPLAEGPASPDFKPALPLSEPGTEPSRTDSGWKPPKTLRQFQNYDSSGVRVAATDSRKSRIDISLSGGAFLAPVPGTSSYSGGGSLDFRYDLPVDDLFRVGVRVGLGVGEMARYVPDCSDGPCYEGPPTLAGFLPTLQMTMEWREASHAFFELTFGSALLLFSPTQTYGNIVFPNWALGIGQVFPIWNRDATVLNIRARIDAVVGLGTGPYYVLLVPTIGLSWSYSTEASRREVGLPQD